LALETRYAARRDWPVERLVESVASLLTVRRRPMARQRVTFLDTSDGRVARAGACLTMTSDPGGNRIHWQQGNQRIGCAPGNTVQFAWDLPPGAARQRIEPIIETRRLLPLAQAEQDGVTLDVMNETRKTIARLHIVAGRARGPGPRSPWRPLPPFLTLSALRGYDEQCAVPIAIIDSRPGVERTDLALQAHVLRTIGATVPQDATVYRVDLDPAVRADVGSLRMLRELLRIVSANHAGVVDGIDSEFLHDFRSGVRRSLTLIEQIDGALPQAEIDLLQTELSWLVRITSPARDLDVLLGGLRSESKPLDEIQQRHIVAALEEERARMQAALVVALTSERYRQLMARWTQLPSGEATAGPGEGCSALPLSTIIAQRGGRLYERTLCAIERVRSDTPADELRQIHCSTNRLRNLLDAAVGLYETEALAVVLPALSRLQAVLGEFNDACNQASWLRQYAVSSNAAGRNTTMASEIAVALAEAASRRAHALRKPANQQLLRFGESANRAAFERIFHIKHLIEIVQ